MTTLKAYKYRLYPNDTQVVFLEQNFGAVRFVWNQLVQNFNEYSTEGPNRVLTEKTLKDKPEHSWLKDVISYALQQKRMDFDEYKTQFFNKKRKVKLGCPSFKSKKSHRDSFRIPFASLPNGAIDLDGCVIKLPKMSDPIKMKVDRKFNGNPKSITVSRNHSGQYFVSVLVEETVELKPCTGKSIGIDMGLKDLFIFSDGTVINNPKWFRESQSKLTKAQRHLSSKTKGSARYEKQRVKVAKIHQHIVNQRQWLLHNLSTYLVNNYDEIIVENLNVKGMVKNHKLSKSISDASWSTFVSMLSYKSNWYGRTFHKIDRFCPSSKTCGCCGHIVDKLPLSIREWQCPSCETIHDRDLNAARNILSKGINDLYGTSGEYLDYSRGDMVSLGQVHPVLAQSMKRSETVKEV